MNSPNTQYPILNTQNVACNILTVDVEDYFHVGNLSKVVDSADWGNYESRVVANTEKLLEAFEVEKVKATFFVLGWVAERFPELVRKIYQAGHEVASHGFGHRPVHSQNQDEFREDLRKSKRVLEDVIGDKVSGYRAPTFSIGQQTLWALDILKEEGFNYDSSFFPFRYSPGGLPDEKRYPHKITRSQGHKSQGHKSQGHMLQGYESKREYIWELPISTIKLFGCNWPFSGGGYFRLCPLAIIKKGIKLINQQGHPAIVYIHPWEIDPQQPRFKVNRLGAFRHYYNLAGCEAKLKNLIRFFNFGTASEYMLQVTRSQVTRSQVTSHK